MSSALGFIETKGLLAAVEAADAMLKAADVCLLEKTLATGGLVTISVAGEVAAVQAAVDAGAAAVGRIQGSTLVSRHVIPRPDKELAYIIRTRPLAAPCAYEAPRGAEKAVPAVSVAATAEPQSAPVPSGAATEAFPAWGRAELEKMSVAKLRQIAMTLPGLPLDSAKLAKAAKKDIIDAIVTACRQQGE